MKTTDLSRRAFLHGKRAKDEQNTIRPPWTVKATFFTETCTRCDQCIQACPEKILIRGDGGFPEVDFKQGACTFCAVCADACSSKAFQFFKTETPHDICSTPAKAWHLNVSIQSTCLSLNGIVCRVCGECCNEEAIQFQLQLGGLSTPLIDTDKCNGCGECLYVCPKNAVLIKNANN